MQGISALQLDNAHKEYEIKKAIWGYLRLFTPRHLCRSINCTVKGISALQLDNAHKEYEIKKAIFGLLTASYSKALIPHKEVLKRVPFHKLYRQRY